MWKIKIPLNHNKPELHSTTSNTYKICWEIYKIGIVLIYEFYHSSFKEFVIELQILSELFQLHTFPAVWHKVINIKIRLKQETEEDVSKQFTQGTDPN